mmetsp:Transcript_146552/g.468085  ORF Transcript_146552/g.468085 Transcript_146552/m.468085 type:complete len:401 (+) Transcript_146552:163-1365(+)
MAVCCSAQLWWLFASPKKGLQRDEGNKHTQDISADEGLEEGKKHLYDASAVQDLHTSCLMGLPALLDDAQDRWARRSYLGAPWSSAKLVLHNPYMASPGVLAHPFQVIALLKKCEVGKLDLFCSACPAEVVQEALPQLLRHVERQQLVSVLVPLLNNVELHAPLVSMLRRVDVLRLAEILNGALPGKLDILLRCPGETVVDITCAVKDDRVSAMLALANHAPDKLLDLVSNCPGPEKAAAFVNFVEPEVVIWLLDSASPLCLAQLLGYFEVAELRSDGPLMRFLGHLDGERRLTKGIVGPFLLLVKPAVVAQLVREVTAEQLFKVLSHVGPHGVARILENTNVDLIIRMWTGSLESLVVFGAAPLSAIQKDCRAAATIKQVTDSIQRCLSSFPQLALCSS